jgi:transcriptional regulator with XRE-family HTH domain
MQPHDTRLNGAVVRYWRTRLHLTQAELGLLCGLYQQHISLLERGKRRHVYPQTLCKLALALEVAMEELVGEERRERPGEGKPRRLT